MQEFQLAGQVRQQGFGRGGLAEDVAHLVAHVRGLGERAQVQADDCALQPAAGGFGRIVVVGVHGGSEHSPADAGRACWRLRRGPATIGASPSFHGVPMAATKEARVPDIGGFDDVPVIEVLVSVGDTVKQDQGLVTLESDKATMEVPAPFAGVVKELKVEVGDSLSEGGGVAVIEAEDEGGGEKPAESSAGSREQPKAESKAESKAEPKAKSEGTPKRAAETG